MEWKPGKGSGHRKKPDPPPKPSMDPVVVGQKLQDLTVKVAQLEETTSALLNREQTTTAWQERNTQLSAELSVLQDDIRKQRIEHAKLRTSHSELREQHIRLVQDNAELQQQMAELKVYLGTFHAEQKNVLTAHDALRENQEKLNAEMNTMSPDLQTQQSEVEKLREEQSDMVKEMASVREEITSLSNDLAAVKDPNSPARQLSAEILRLQSDISQPPTHHNDPQTEVTKLQAGHNRQETEEQNDWKTEEHNDRKKTEEDDRKKTEEDDRMKTGQGHSQAGKSTIRSAQARNAESSLVRLRQILREQEFPQTPGSRMMDMENMQASLQRSLDKATASLADLQASLGSSRELFYVHGVDRAATKRLQRMRFRSVWINDGDHFHQESGVFTSPQAGLYFFTASVKSASSEKPVSALVTTDQHVSAQRSAVGRCYVVGGAEGGAGSVMVRLAAKDKVWLRAANAGEDYDDYLYSCDHGWRHFSHFSGTLVLAA